MATTTTRSLRDRIAFAATVKEIDTLLEEGKRYESASRQTRSKWQQAAERRRAQLAKIQ